MGEGVTCADVQLADGCVRKHILFRYDICSCHPRVLSTIGPLLLARDCVCFTLINGKHEWWHVPPPHGSQKGPKPCVDQVDNVWAPRLHSKYRFSKSPAKEGQTGPSANAGLTTTIQSSSLCDDCAACPTPTFEYSFPSGRHQTAKQCEHSSSALLPGLHLSRCCMQEADLDSDTVMRVGLDSVMIACTSSLCRTWPSL
jgi:hypothetical protein